MGGPEREPGRREPEGSGALVLGIGNILLRDDGVGVVVAQSIEAARQAGDPRLPPGTRVVDGGTLGLGLLALVAEARQIVIVDALDLGRPPGTVTVLRDASVWARLPGRSSLQEAGAGDLVAAARLLGSVPPRLTLVGIQPAEIATGQGLTASVAAAVDEAIELVRLELAPDAA